MKQRITANGLIMVAVISLFVMLSGQALFAAPRKNESIVYTTGKRIYEYHYKDDKFSCDTCHKNVDSKNFQLTRKESELCYECHARVDEADWVHGPIGVGQCSVCHDPHGTTKPNFLVRKGDSLCYYCHSEVRLKQHAEEAESRSCTYCHESHSGDTNVLLRK